MERLTRIRARILAVVFALIAVFFVWKLYDLQIIQTGGGNVDNTSTFTTRTRVKASRGEVLDINGNVLISNRAGYDLVLNHYVLETADGTNQYLYDLVKTCEEHNIQYNDSFPISRTRPFVYKLSEQTSAQQKNFQSYLEYMERLDSDITAPLLIEELRSRYSIPEEWTEDEARAVIGLRYEMDLRGCVWSLPLFVFLSDVTDQQLSTILELNVPGLAPEATPVREYTTDYAAHVLGHVGAMTPSQWEYYSTVDGYEMDAQVGQSGLEAEYEEYLHGVDGIRVDTVTTDGTLVSSYYEKEPKAGANVEISIDINLQMAAEDAFAELVKQLRSREGGDGSDIEGGAVVAIDVKTGQVLVCASYPTYKLSTYFEDYNQILEEPYNPLFNRALQAMYPPGSTYKMSMVVAAINNGYLSPNETIYDAKIYTKHNLDVKCLYYTSYGMSHGNIDAAEALQRSCNYFFYELGDRVPNSVSDSTAKGFGLGEPTGVELDEEIGWRTNDATKKALYKGEAANLVWADRIISAIGQSDNQFTPIQLAVYAATLANEGTRYKATFMNRVVSADYRSLLLENKPSVLSNMEISDGAVNAYKKGMYMVAHESGGTAYKTFKDYPIKIGAKTGTAQHSRGGSDNGAFVCFAPYENPQIAIAVYGEKAGHGGDMAVVAKAILDVYFEVGQIGDVNTYENKLS